jgi:hypothetical protein
MNVVIDDQDPELQNLSMESVIRNKKSYFRIFEGVRLTDPWVKQLIMQGPPQNQVRKNGSFNLYQDLLRGPLGGNS